MKKIFLLMLIFSLTACTPPDQNQGSQQDDISADLRHPLHENKGQFPEQVLYYSQYDDRNTFLTTSGITYDRSHPDGNRHVVKLQFLDADFTIETHTEKSSESSYFVGEQRITGIGGYPSVISKDLYEGVRLVLFPDTRDLSFQFKVDAIADLDQIRFSLEGCQELRITDTQDLLCQTEGYERIFYHPSVDSGEVLFKDYGNRVYGYEYSGDSLQGDQIIQTTR